MACTKMDLHRADNNWRLNAFAKCNKKSEKMDRNTLARPAVVSLVLFAFLLLPVACSTSNSAPPSLIPDNFTTYTHENLFSISYPSDWHLLTPTESEVLSGEYLDSGITLLFMSGEKLEGEGYLPNVSVAAYSAEGRTLDDVVYEFENTPDLEQLYFYDERTVGRNAVRMGYGAYLPSGKAVAVVQEIVSKGDTNWVVTLVCEKEDWYKNMDWYLSIPISLVIEVG